MRHRRLPQAQSDPLWYKDAIIYELHVRAFYDSNGDGIGDFQGLIQKLPYLRDLGVTALWLLPFYPSPLRDDGYDIADYRTVHPDYGTLHDFRVFVQKAHAYGLKVITELVVNHTSDQHPWFQAARRARPGSRKRNYYVWSDTDTKYAETRIIFVDTEKSNWTWDPVAGAYYWHRFFSHQPDLNFANPQVLKAIFRVMRFWLDIGVDGLRLDAIPYLCEREGTINENLPETHAVLKEMRRLLDQHYEARMFLAEANQWPADVLPYFGDEDECHMAFHFPLMPRIFMALRQADRHPITEILRQTPEIPDTCQWALFLRNHDEFTLEMVTDEERDYMYREYAIDARMRLNLGIRRRLAPMMEDDLNRVRLLYGLLFSLPGTPVFYYGDEIGMGENIFLGDRNGVRTPMQWSGDRNAGFSRADPQRLYLPAIMDPLYGYQTVNVENQERNSASLLWWMKRSIALRKQHTVFGHGRTTFLSPNNRKILAYVRHDETDTILVLANLSNQVQPVELDLTAYEGLMQAAAPPLYLVVIEVAYTQGGAETYTLLLGISTDEDAKTLLQTDPTCVLARVRSRQGEGLLHDAVGTEAAATLLLAQIHEQHHITSAAGEFRAFVTRAYPDVRGPAEEPLTIRRVQGEQSNSSMIYGSRLILKFVRRIEAGIHPELDMGRYLTGKTALPLIPPLAGGLTHPPPSAVPITNTLLPCLITSSRTGRGYTPGPLAIT